MLVRFRWGQAGGSDSTSGLGRRVVLLGFLRRGPSLDLPTIIPLPPRVCLLVLYHPRSRGGPMADAWHGPTLSDEALAFGALALIAPLLQRLDIAPIIDRHLPPDPQLAFSHGRVLGL